MYRLLLRVPTARYRSLPRYLIIGGMRCGTSSLSWYLTQHPDILKSFRKEVHFFDRNFHRGENWYRSFFPLSSRIGSERITGEASPNYLFHPHTPRRIRQLLPDVKLIVLLRNPTERAISHYFHFHRRKHKTLSLSDSIRLEDERLAEERTPLLNDDRYVSPDHVIPSYKKRGHYAEQIRRYLCYFKKAQLLVLPSESLFTETEETLQRAFTFLGVRPGFTVSNLAARNIGHNRLGVPGDVRRLLDDYFAPLNQDLYDLLGEDLNW